MDKVTEGIPPSDNNKYDKVILIQALKEEVDELKDIIKQAEHHINTTSLSIPNETLTRIFKGIPESSDDE